MHYQDTSWWRGNALRWWRTSLPGESLSICSHAATSILLHQNKMKIISTLLRLFSSWWFSSQTPSPLTKLLHWSLPHILWAISIPLWILALQPLTSLSSPNLYPLYLMGTHQVSDLTDTTFPYFLQLQGLLLLYSTPSIIQFKQKTIKKWIKKNNRYFDAT